MFTKSIAHVLFVACLTLAAGFTPGTATAQPGVTAQLVSDRAEISVEAGGWQHFDLDAGPDQAHRWYLILGSISGTGPGVSLHGFTIPLNYDIYTEFTLTRPNAGFIRNQLGKLDAAGNAVADFFVPAGLAKDLVGLEINHAYVVADKNGRISAVSNPAPLVLTD